jgi:hypothetical protein
MVQAISNQKPHVPDSPLAGKSFSLGLLNQRCRYRAIAQRFRLATNLSKNASKTLVDTKAF